MPNRYARAHEAHRAEQFTTIPLRLQLNAGGGDVSAVAVERGSERPRVQRGVSQLVCLHDAAQALLMRTLGIAAQGNLRTPSSVRA